MYIYISIYVNKYTHKHTHTAAPVSRIGIMEGINRNKKKLEAINEYQYTLENDNESENNDENKNDNYDYGNYKENNQRGVFEDSTKEGEWMSWNVDVIA